MYNQDQIVIVCPVEHRYTREHLLELCEQLSVEMEKINKLLDECFARCQAQLDAESDKDS